MKRLTVLDEEFSNRKELDDAIQNQENKNQSAVVEC
jgi:hypothetical protein